MKLFLHFIKEKRNDLILYLITLAIFVLIPALYGLPLYAIGYAALLSFTFFIFLFTVGFIRFFRKHNTLSHKKMSILNELNGLPSPESPIEEDYQELISLLFSDKQNLINKKEKEWQETIDYYTLWAHQIKTPISAMHLMLQGDEITEENEKKELEAELFKIEQYVEMVLQFLRLNSPSTDYRFENCDLDQIVRGVVRKFAPIFIRKKLSMQYEPLNCTVITDEKWLSFVLEQLLSNALKYTKKGYIHIYMDPKQKRTLIIEDTGIGIREEDLPRIFEKGYTGYNGRMDKKATGIGLYLCKRILGNLSHKITITSKTGSGTKVAIDFSQYKILPD